MKTKLKTHFPLLFLVSICCWWAFYYQSNSQINNYGAANFEWLFLLDSLLVLPVLCFVCISDKKKAGIKALTFVCLAVLLGSFIIPEQSKIVWLYLEDARYAVLALFLAFELTAITSVYLAVRAALKTHIDPDCAIQEPIERYLGKSIVSKIIGLESRMWTYALFANRVNAANFDGNQHFTYDKKDGAKSNLLGFILVTLIEIPLMHLLLHFVWSPLAANIVTGLTLFGALFFIAEYRAVSLRPISISKSHLTVRYGILSPFVVPIENIKKVCEHDEFVGRGASLKRFNYFGVPNVKIRLKEPIAEVSDIYIGVDEAQKFRHALEDAMTSVIHKPCKKESD
jgi:hypothetical protein